ncbi:leucyl aminopeptidase [Temperatibacter marinus]|uniref:Probable cytosol aminopeptidase n=1 Tax=Temperatibacter marinus TaxID=1456591 RepID=A0AA52ECU2_9PROT|nr:leucyl aminopeptidase [Temperatibacter marinus]WND02340.1 leucyl aminopeptidase [Temperatibacter marinus]
MNIKFISSSLPKNGIVIVGIAQDCPENALVKSLNDTMEGALERAVKIHDFQGKKGTDFTIPAPHGCSFDKLVIMGLGKKAKMKEIDYVTLGATITSSQQLSGKEAAVFIEGLSAEEAAWVGEGALLRSYRFDKYRTKEPKKKIPILKTISIAAEDTKKAGGAFKVREAVAEGVFLTRDLVSEPGNKLHPESFADEVAKLTDFGVDIEILGEEEMTKLGMEALLAVGMGSVRESKLAIMRWNGANKSDEQPIAFVGKGVTFDTGGISLKPGAGMDAMKWDMGGAGTVVGLMKALAARKARVNVIGVVGLVENMPAGNAQRPGDIVTSMSGQTIDVLNTDAEGRLVLCDAMWYTQDRFKPKFMIDLATLTGAMIVALGHEYAGIFSDSDELADDLYAAGTVTGDKVWRMPVHDDYDKLINTHTADMKNIGGKGAGSITAAQFLKRYTNGVPWCHIDIAGTVWSDKGLPLSEKGGTGFGVRLLDRFVADNHES